MTQEEREKIAEEMQALKVLCRNAHEKATDGKLTTCCHCACGSGMGGPAGSDACRAIKRIGRILQGLLPAAQDKPTERTREIEEVYSWL